MQVKGLTQTLKPSGPTPPLRRANSSSKSLTPRSNSRLGRVLQRSQHSTPAALQRQGHLGRGDPEEVQDTLPASPSDSDTGPVENNSPR